MMIKINIRLLFLGVLFFLLALTYSIAQIHSDAQFLRPDKVVGPGMENIFVLNQAQRVKYNKFDNLLYVVDMKDNDIKVFDTDLNFVKQIGRFGQGPGEFQAPFHIAFDKEGKIYVADYRNARIQVFDKDFNSVATIMHRFDHFLNEYIEVDSKGNIYVCANKFNDEMFTVYNLKGEIIDKFGEPLFDQKDGYKNNPSKRRFINKVHFAIDKNDEVYCGYQLKPIIQKYSRKHELLYQVDLSYLDQAKKMKKHYELKKNPAIIVDYIMYLTVDDNYIYLKLKHPDKKNKEYNQIYILRKENGEIVSKKNIKVYPDQKQTEFIFYLEPSHPKYLFFTEVLSCSLVRVKKSNTFQNFLSK